MEKNLSCANCGTINCRSLTKEFPDFCLTKNSQAENSVALAAYLEDPLTSKIAKASAEVEGIFYKQLTRVEEIMEFAMRVDIKKIGIATCGALIEEARIFKRILDAHDFDNCTVICKVGANDKTTIGIKPEHKLNKGKAHESLCNPIAQAKILNKEKTGLNVLLGLCVGHDSLFYKHSQALCTTLITKDRVLGHNPAVALYTVKSYNKHLLQVD